MIFYSCFFLYNLECILAKLTESPGSPFSPFSPSKPSHPCNNKKGTRLFQWWPADASQNQTGLQCSERVDAQRRAALTLSPRSPGVPGSPFWHLDRPLRPFSPCLAKNSGGEKKKKNTIGSFVSLFETSALITIYNQRWRQNEAHLVSAEAPAGC